jgi:hypothetical protein
VPAEEVAIPALTLAGYFLCAAPLSMLLGLRMFGQVAAGPRVSGAGQRGIYVGFFEMGFTWLLWSAPLRAASNASRVGNLIFLSPLLSLVLIYSGARRGDSPGHAGRPGADRAGYHPAAARPAAAAADRAAVLLQALR